MGAREDLEANLPANVLIPGDLPAVKAVAKDAAAMAETFGEVRKGLRYLDLQPTDWSGQAASAYFVVQDAHTARLKTAVTAFDTAHAALVTYANQLRDARDLARAARQAYNDGRAKRDSDIANCVPPPPPTSPLIPYDPYGLDAATTKLVEARHGVELAAAACAKALEEAAEAAPVAPPPPAKQFDGVSFPWQTVFSPTFVPPLPQDWTADNGLVGLGAGVLQGLIDLVPTNPLGMGPLGLLAGAGDGRDYSARYQAGYWASMVATLGAGAGKAGATKGLSSLLSKLFNKPRAVDAVETLASRQHGWRVGDPIENLTAKGTEPAWTTVRARYWKNVAHEALPGEFSAADMARMAKGEPPLHPQIHVSKELDHVVQRHEGGTHAKENLREVWPWEHAALDPYRHYTGPVPYDFDPDTYRKGTAE